MYPVRSASKSIKMGWFSHSNREYFEKKFIVKKFPSGTVPYTIPVYVPYPHAGKEFVLVHLKVIVSNAHDSDVEGEKPYLFVFHGVGSSATLMLSTTISSLTQHFNVVSIDVPGLGRSVTDNLSLENLSADECLSFFRAFYRIFFMGYADTIIQTHKQRQTSRASPLAPHTGATSSAVYVLGHSLGGYLSVMSLFDWTNSPHKSCATQHSVSDYCSGVLTPIAGLILVCPAGVLPSLSPHGAYWAVLFYTGFPMSILRSMGSTLSSLLTIPFMDMGGHYNHPRTPYWVQLQASSDMVNVAKKFMNVGYQSMYWTHPCLQCILRSRLPVGLVWGEKDGIMPMDTGRLTVELCKKLDKDIHMDVVEGAGHTPFHYEGGVDFAEKVKDAVFKIHKNATQCGAMAGTGGGQHVGTRLQPRKKPLYDDLIHAHICGLLDETYALNVMKVECGLNGSAVVPDGAASSQHVQSEQDDGTPDEAAPLLQVHGDTLLDSSMHHHQHSHRYIHTSRWTSSFSLQATRENLEDMYRHLHSSVDRIAALLQNDISLDSHTFGSD